jgi:hypothetical protein
VNNYSDKVKLEVWSQGNFRYLFEGARKTATLDALAVQAYSGGCNNSERDTCSGGGLVFREAVTTAHILMCMNLVTPQRTITIAQTSMYTSPAPCTLSKSGV